MKLLPRSVLRQFRWRTRLTLWSFAGLAGLVTAFFAKAADWALSLFFSLWHQSHTLPLLWTPLVGMVTVALTLRYFPGIQGSGIPQIIAATRLSARGERVSHLVSLRIAIGKVALGALALTGGYSAGREGPSVQVSASILQLAHRFLPHSRAIRESDLILAGGAAGVAAAFNAPLAGVVFAIEELGRRLEVRTSGILLGAIILSGLTSMGLLGNYNYFGRIRIESLDLSIVWPLVVCGVIGGLGGGAFSLLLQWPQRQPQFVLWQWRRDHPVWFAGGCGVVVAVLGTLTGGKSFGSGYSVTLPLVEGVSDQTAAFIPVARFLATVASYLAGIPGGIFAPALSIGGTFGSSIAPVLGYDPVIVVTLGMAAFLAAVTQAPITSAIIVMEMVDGHRMTISLMAVALLARGVSSRLGPELYQQLARSFLPPPKPETQGIAEPD